MSENSMLEKWRSANSKQVCKSKPQKKREAELNPLESEEQQLIFAWARIMEKQHPELELLVAVPNGGLRNMPEAVRFKAEGVRKGFPDMLLPVARGAYHSLAIELKRRKGGVVSPEQKAWIAALNEQGWLAVVCRGADEAIEVITDYLRGARKIVENSEVMICQQEN
jgi:hypothetical protein